MYFLFPKSALYFLLFFGIFSCEEELDLIVCYFLFKILLLIVFLLCDFLFGEDELS